MIRSLVLVGAALLLTAAPAGAATIHVPADYPTIQGAINATSPGDEIIVAPGTYGPITVSSHRIIRSSGGREVTFIDGQGVSRCALLSGNPGAELIGFTLQNGLAETSQGGGGILIYRGTARECTISACSGGLSSSGGGAALLESMALLSNCVISDCSAVYGGGAYLGGGLIEHTQITGCLASNRGGGVVNYGGVLTDCTISECQAPGGEGGGVFIQGSAPSLQRCNISSNSARYGGGCNAWGGTLVDCLIAGNHASDFGAGVYNLVAVSSLYVLGCTIRDNTAGILGGGIVLAAAGEPSMFLSLSDTLICANTPGNLLGPYIDNGGNTISASCVTELIGACCINGGCLVLSQGECDSVGGVFLGEGAACGSVSCDLGACCVGDQCLMLDLDACFSAGGSFAGIGIPCRSTTCEAICLSDLTFDGLVNFDDLLQMLADWGPCPP